METAIFIPTLWRAGRLQGLVNNIKNSTPEPHQIYILGEIYDEGTLIFARDCPDVKIIEVQDTSVPSALEQAFNMTTEDFIVLGNDDFVFTPDWLGAALRAMEGHEVVGCCTGVEPHEAACLVVRRSGAPYTLDKSDKLVWRGYNHYCADSEICAIAQHRGTYKHCCESIVNHNHVHDRTYKKVQEKFRRDAQFFHTRLAKAGVKACDFV